MQATDSLPPVKAPGFGCLFSAVNPKKFILAIAVVTVVVSAGSSIANEAIAYGVFVIVSSLGIAIPRLLNRVGGDNAKNTLDRFWVWLIAHIDAMTMVLLLTLGTMSLGQVLGTILGEETCESRYFAAEIQLSE